MTHTHRTVRSGLLTLLAVIAIGSAGCASTSVNEILADPSKYRDRNVKISGDVVDSYSFADRGAYRVKDGTGELWVVSTTGVPRRTARVTVKGRVREGFNLGVLGDNVKLPPGVAAGLVLLESSHKAKR